MNRKSWSSQRSGPIRLGDKTPSEAADVPLTKIHAVPKAALEKGIIQLLASAAEMQQRQDFDSALQVYEAAMDKVKAHGLNRKRLFTGTSKKPPPLNSKTPLQWCLHVGDIPSAICLIGSPNAALVEFRNTGSTDRIRKSLEAGADIEYRLGPMGRTLLLQEAAEGRHAGVRLALDQGANMSMMDDNGDSALALALSYDNPEAGLIITDLTAAGADINGRDGKGRPLFELAISQGQPKVVSQVIDAISPLREDHRGQMRKWIMELLAQDKSWNDRTCEVLQILIGQGLDPNLQLQSKGRSLLGVACGQQLASCEALVETLLSHGATPHLEAGMFNGRPRTIGVILTNVTPLTIAHQQQIENWMKTLNVNSQKWPPRVREIFDLLLDHGLDPDLRSPVAPHSPLILNAANAGDLALVKKLVTLKAHLEAADDHSWTALTCAAMNHNRAVYDALRQAGVDDRSFFGLSTVWSSHNAN